MNEDQIKELLNTRARLDQNETFLSYFQKHKEKVSAITFLTGGNPRLVLMLYDIIGKNQLVPVVEALRETIDKLTPLLKDILERMPAQQSKVLDSLMRLNGVASPSEIAGQSRLPLNVVTTQLGRLKKSRFVDVLGGGRGKPSTYRVCDQMFKTWYQMRYLRPARRRIELFVEFLQAWFSTEERLDQFVELRLKSEEALSGGQHLQASGMALAMEYLAASFQDNIKRATFLDIVASVYIKADKLQEAAFILADLHYQSIKTSDKYESMGHLAVARKLEKEGTLSQAITSYKEALRKDTSNAEARLILGLCFFQKEDYLNAIKELTKTINIPGVSPGIMCEGHIYRALSRGNLGDEDGAIDDCTTVTRQDGATKAQVALAYNYRGATKDKINDYEGAIRDFSTVIELENAPADFIALSLNYRGQTKAKISDYQGAVQDCTSVINLPGISKEQIAFALNIRSALKDKLGDYEGAIKDCTTVIEMEGAPPERVIRALNVRSWTRGKLQDYKGSVEDCTAVINQKNSSQEEIVISLNVRGVARRELGDFEGANRDFTSVIENKESPVDQIAEAFIQRGELKTKLEDYDGAFLDFTDSIEREGTTINQVSRALNNRGNIKRELGDINGEILDYTKVIELKGAPIDQVALALNMRAECQSRRGNLKLALEDCTSVIELEGVPEDQVTIALTFRSGVNGALGNFEDAIKDSTSVINLGNVPEEQIAGVLINRCIAKGNCHDHEGAIADATALIGLKGAPENLVAQALNLRGLSRRIIENYESALEDFNIVLSMKGIPEKQVILALGIRAQTKQNLGDMEGAVEDFTKCAESGVSGILLYDTLEMLITIAYKEHHPADVKFWVNRVKELEPPDTPMEIKLAGRVKIVRTIARECSPDAATEILGMFLSADNEPELTRRLEFMTPALKYAKTKDESVLAKLSQEEQKIAKRIASRINTSMNSKNL
ncbi:MAG: tetratricopeptide repeat protein [Candidatus Auribacterota bacterium]|nr:tetratricopeptide repeat protein [Candidatus Auribacterota bacterium]